MLGYYKYQKYGIVSGMPFLVIHRGYICNRDNFRVRTGPGKPGKSWNFVMAFSRTGKSWKKATGPGKSWKSV